jgi:hypothetical protein
MTATSSDVVDWSLSERMNAPVQPATPDALRPRLRISITGRRVAELGREEQLELRRIVDNALADVSTEGTRDPDLPIILGHSADASGRLPNSTALSVQRAVAAHLKTKSVASGAGRELNTDDPAAGARSHLGNDAVCICMGSAAAADEYPVIDPRTSAGPGPHAYGLYLFEDTLRMTVETDPSLTGCQMRVGLASEVTSAKEVAGWHLCNGQTSVVTTANANRGPNFMLLDKAHCNFGTHTIVLRKAKLFWVITPMYCFDLDTFWPFLGGKKVTFTWLSDTYGSGKHGHESTVRKSTGDGTLLKGDQQPEVFIIFGGAKFWVPSPTELAALGRSFTEVTTIPQQTMDRFSTQPGDGTLVKERSHPAVFVCQGGAKFHIPDPATFEAMGFLWADIGTVPDGALASVPDIPYDGALLRERSSDPVFVIQNGQRSHVSSPTRMSDLCLYWENVRTVPDNALAAIPPGPTL